MPQRTWVWCADRLGMLEALGTSTPDERVRAEVAKGLVEAETELRAGGNVDCRRKLPELDAKIRRGPASCKIDIGRGCWSCATRQVIPWAS